MLIVIPAAIASLCYLAATFMQIQNILKGTQFTQVKILGAVAIILHGITTFQLFQVADGFNLGIYPMLSLMMLSIVAIVLISSFRRPVDNLFTVLFPIAMVTIVMELTLTSEYVPRSELSGGIFSHIALSIIAYSLLTIAAAHALLLSFGDNLLRNHSLVILRNMPPLETMEHLMFEMIWVGMIFLTLSIGSGFAFLENISSPGLIHHTVITLAAWVVFTILMWGRYQLGWRGAIASRWTLCGFVLLVLGYFGSKVALELVLGRA
jgi:ABC-type uncharacterized transport system permease subunit